MNIELNRGITISAYGWVVDEDRTEPCVFLGLRAAGLSADVTMTPDEARRVAAMLVECARCAEVTA